MKSRLLAGLGAAILALSMAGCAGTADSSASSSGDSPDSTASTTAAAPTDGGSSTAAGSDFSVGIEFTGTQNDGGFDEALYNGLLDAQQKHGIKIQVAENKTSIDTQVAAVQALAQSNNMVIVVSFIGDAINPIAKQYPDVHFYTVDGDLNPSIPNLHSFRVNQGVAAYVAGVVAAGMTKSNTVGYVGATEIPTTAGSYEGFTLGVHSVNADIKVLKTYTGSWVDSTAAKEATEAQIAQGADVIYAYLDSATDGSLAAVSGSDKDVKIFVTSKPRCDEGAYVAGADIVTPTDFVSNIVTNAMEGNHPTDKPELKLDDANDQRIEMCPGFEQYQAAADAATQAVVDGSANLPDSVV
jgi:basic membrane protein A